MSSSRATLGVLREPALLAALGFGAGLVPRSPGTAGTVVGVLVYLLLLPLSPGLHALAVVTIVVAGIPLCGHAARRLQVHDDPAIVWDEIAGYLIAMTALPSTPGWMLAAFVLFRLLDIAKPGVIRSADRRLDGGLGIMADDLLAGAATCGLLHLLRWLIGG